MSIGEERETMIEKAAMALGQMPEGLTCPEQCYFIGLKMLYSMFKKNMITREEGSELKKGILKEYRLFAVEYRLSSWWADCFKKTEEACARYRKDRTLENADLILKSIDKIEVKY